MADMQYKKITSVEPPSLEKITFASLNASERETLWSASQNLDAAHSPQTLNHRSAALGYKMPPEEKLLFARGTNCDEANRGRNCAEHNALSGLFHETNSRFIEALPVALALISKRLNGADEGFERPVAPCGICRTVLTARSQLGDFQPLLPADLSVVLSCTRQEEILKVPLGDLMPLQYLSGQFDAASIAALRLQTVEILNRSELGESEVLEGFKGDTLLKMLRVADDAVDHSVIQNGSLPEGAAVLTYDDQIVPGTKLCIGEDSVRHADRVAILRAQSDLGTTMLKALVISGNKNTQTGGIIVPSGRSRQLVFDRAQLAGVDIPVFMAIRDQDEIVMTRISELFPMGEGLLESSSTAPNLDLYRLVNGKRISK